MWGEIVPGLPFHATLEPEERTRLLEIARVFDAETRWEGCGGLELTPAMRVTIAAQAAFLLLGLEDRYFSEVESVFVYPSTYIRPGHVRATEEDIRALLGEAWLRGPVVLAWDSARGGALHPHDGRNLVLHEFAHKLDMEDGFIDGTPPIARNAYPRWREVFTREFERLREDAGKGRRTVLDPYGATNPGEFFAVATETFFEQGQRLRKEHPELYTLMREYYQQDPAGRPRAESRFE